jgi:glutathione S-transferase
MLVPLIAPLVRRLARSAYKITPESAQRSLDRVHGGFEEVSARLGDGRRFLSGERFTAADLTFASLAAPMVFPPECRAVLPPLAALPALMRDEILRLRDTCAGRFALRMFAQER